MSDKSAKFNKTGASSPFGFIAFTAWVGAVVYFVGQVDGFWNIALAILKSFVWPAFVLHHVLTLLNI